MCQRGGDGWGGGVAGDMIEMIQIHENVYILKDRAGCCANLVTGREKALLFDTGSGIDDINEAVRMITPLPLVVINSHGHFDHIGGNRQFDRVYMHMDDFCILESYTPDLLARWREEMIHGREGDCRGDGCQDAVCYGTGCQDVACPESPAQSPLHGAWGNMKPLDFHTLDLGQMECRMIPLKGHTAGSVGIWIPKLKLLLSGDALTPVMCLIFQNHLSVEEHYKTLKYVQGINFDYYLTSHHGKAFSRDMIDRLIRCMENSRNGKWHLYQYPCPPYAEGKIYLDSLEPEPVALIC